MNDTGDARRARSGGRDGFLRRPLGAPGRSPIGSVRSKRHLPRVKDCLGSGWDGYHFSGKAFNTPEEAAEAVRRVLVV